MAGFVSFVLFLIGAIPSVTPFLVLDIDPTSGIIALVVLTSFVLTIMGAVKTWATQGNWIMTALENLVIAGFCGGFAYGVGMIFDSAIN